MSRCLRWCLNDTWTHLLYKHNRHGGRLTLHIGRDIYEKKKQALSFENDSATNQM